MMSMNAWKPAGHPSMSPYLICKDAGRLIGFLQDAFGPTGPQKNRHHVREQVARMSAAICG